MLVAEFLRTTPAFTFAVPANCVITESAREIGHAFLATKRLLSRTKETTGQVLCHVSTSIALLFFDNSLSMFVNLNVCAHRWLLLSSLEKKNKSL